MERLAQICSGSTQGGAQYAYASDPRGSGTMPRFIVLPCIGSAADAPVFATALAVARKFSSHLAFLHVRPDVRQEFAALAASEVGAVSGIGDTMERMERDADHREHAAERQWR